MIAPRWRLFPKYATLIIMLVGGMLVASGAIGLYFSWREIQSNLEALQGEKALGAANRIEQYVLDIQHQLGWTAFPRMDTSGDPVEQRRIEYLKLLRQAPAITELVWIGTDGRERLRISRLAMDGVAAGTDHSQDPAFQAAKAGRTYFGPVQFRKGTEPYMAIARPAGGDGGVTVADVNLKFVWDVVSRIRVGAAGLAYAVESSGTLIAHPDISLVLKKTDMSALPQVAAVLKGTAADMERAGAARDLGGHTVLSAHAPIMSLGWEVFVETPRREALAPLTATLWRMGLILAAGLAISVLASFFLARALVRPIRTLQDGAARIGAGELDHRIGVRTGDELEALGEQFNQMTDALKASYVGLERKVDERTKALTEALERQTATAEVLRVISGSPSDTKPVFEAIVQACRRLFGGRAVAVSVPRGAMIETVAFATDGTPGLRQGGFLEPWPLDARSAAGASLLGPRIINVADTEIGALEFPRMRELAMALGYRSGLFVPLVRDGVAHACIGILRATVGAFSDKEVAIAKTFADQALIAIENVRLFNETKEALERQTATAEVLKLISRSTFDLDAVLRTLLDSACRLCAAEGAVLFRPDAQGNYLPAAMHSQAADAKVRERYLEMMRQRPIRAGTDSVAGRALLTRAAVYVDDVRNDPAYGRRDLADTGSFRNVLAVPLLREGEPIGVIAMSNSVDGRPFTPVQLELLTTFADQAVIAIENIRLFSEIQDKSAQLEAANRHKSEFLANMSHELRTPLNAIIGFSEVLTEQMFGEVNDKQMEYLKDIHSSGQHLLMLINDVLDLSKIEAGKMELDLSCFDLGLLLDHSTTLVRERALRHGLTLTLEVGEGLEEWVGDARKVKQSVVNLLSNAVKFTPNGGCVTVRARHLSGVDGHDGGWAEVSISDTGVGIAPEDQALVFEEFRQAGGDVLRKSEGTGLGLALVKRFVELHGGRVRLESEPGRGSTFTFTLPQHELRVLQ